MSEKKSVANSVVRTLIALAIACSLIFLTACSKAKGRVGETTAEGDTALIDDQMDYGIRVTTSITNVGESDSLRITARLSTSEGEWERTQNLHFDANETKKLTYFFHEPTINATNIYYGVSVFPNANQK